MFLVWHISVDGLSRRKFSLQDFMKTRKLNLTLICLEINPQPKDLYLSKTFKGTYFSNGTPGLREKLDFVQCLCD